MSLKEYVHNLSAMCAASILFLATGSGVRGQLFDHCTCEKCPPPYVHCQEGPPCIKFKCSCPKPVCNPCNLRSWGYYENCWHPWPYPPNWSHCRDLPPVPPSGMMVGDPRHGSPVETTLPLPKRVTGN